MPKADIVVAGERLADRTARLLAEVAAPVLEVGPGSTALDVVREEPAGSGPLAALAAGGRALAERGAGRRDALVVAVDMPFLDSALLRLLRDAPRAHAVVPRVDGRAQPLCARYSPVAFRRAAELVAGGARAMHALLAAIDVRWLEEDEWHAVTTAACFVDIDTPEDARRAGIEVPG